MLTTGRYSQHHQGMAEDAGVYHTPGLLAWRTHSEKCTLRDMSMVHFGYRGHLRAEQSVHNIQMPTIPKLNRKGVVRDVYN